MIDGTPPEQGSNLPAAYSQQRPLAPLVAGRGALPGAGYDDEQIPWARYIDAIRRQLWLVALVSAAGIAAAFYVVRQLRPQFEAQATILVTTSGPPTATGALGGDPLLRSAASWDNYIKSFAVLDPVVRDLGLYVGRMQKDSALFRTFSPPAPEFRPGRFRLEIDSAGRSYTLTTLDRSRPPEHGSVGDSIGRAIGWGWAPPDSLLTSGRVVEFYVTTVEAASASLIGNLTTGLPDQGQFLTLRLAGTEPQRTAATLNAWAKQVVTTAFADKKSTLTTNRQTIASQLGVVQKDLSDADASLQRFRQDHSTLQVDNAAAASNASAAIYIQSQLQLDSVQHIRRQLDSIVASADTAGVNPDRYYLVPAALAEWTLLRKDVEDAMKLRDSVSALQRQGLTLENTKVRPTYDAYKTLVTQRLPATTRDITDRLRRTEADLASRVKSESATLNSIPSLALEYQRLNARVATSQGTFNSLQAKFETIKLAEDQTTPDLRLFQEALPPRLPTSNRAPQLFLIAVLASIAAGLGLALFRDRLDSRFRYPEQAAVDLGLTIVGTVPNLSFTRRGELSVDASFQVVESFRVLRLAIRHQFAPGQPVVLCVSSPGPAEGKSLVSSNLAVAFANSGQRTLLVDGDVRRGVVHTTFSVSRRPGLIDYLGNNAPTDSIIQATATKNLFVVASGSHSRRAPEFLVSDRMSTFVSEVRGRFDVVIIDSAPFAAGMDAYALGATAGAMLVVLRRGYTDRKLAAAKLEILDRLPVSMLGSVVNGISSSASYRYYSYDAGYAIDEQLKEEGDFPDAGSGGTPVGLAERK